MRQTLIIVAIMLLALSLGACGGGPAGETDEDRDRQAIQEVLETYLPLLASAYSTGDLTPLQPYAAQKEVASIHKRVQDLADQGRTLQATLRSVTIEDIKAWNYSNAYVTTHEVWDLEVYATGTDTILAKEYEQPNRVKYQLKREDDGWRILFREIQE